MPNTVIALKKSNTSAAIPSSLEFGELAINYKDGRLFYKAGNGSIASFGTTGTSFGTINANNTLIIADSPGAVVSLITGNSISIVGDAVNDKITIGVKDSPTFYGDTTVRGGGKFIAGAVGGDEGGEILLEKPPNGTLDGGITIDAYQNKLRIFEQGGSARGVYIDLAAASAGVGTDLLASSGSTDTTARATANAAFDKANQVGEAVTTANGNITAAFNKANAAGLPITTNIDTINATRYLIFGDTISGTLTSANVSYGLTYNPSSNTIGAINLNANGDIFVGPSTTTAVQTFYRQSGGSGIGYIQCGYANSATDLHLGNWAGNIGRIVIAGSGNIGIGTNLPTSRLHVNGNANIRSLGVGTDASGVLGEVRATVMRDSRGDVRDLPIVNQIVGYGISLNDAGEVVSTNTTIFVPNNIFFAGNAVSVFNNSAASITITQNSSVTMYLAGTATTGNRTLAQRGVATILCVAANTFVVSGAGLT